VKTDDIGIRLVNGRPAWFITCTNTSTASAYRAMPFPNPADPANGCGDPCSGPHNTRAELEASGIGVVPGTDPACSVVFVPIISATG
jgi:hypothetical protein